MAFAAPERFGQPLGEMNTTPLIDVMLVLLVMFILAVPAAVHEVPIDLPVPGSIINFPPVLPRNQVTMSAGARLSWNGAVLDEGQLLAALTAAAKLKPEPLVTFVPDGRAPYGAAARVLRLVKYSGVSAFAFVGNEQYAQFGRAAAQR